MIATCTKCGKPFERAETCKRTCCAACRRQYERPYREKNTELHKQYRQNPEYRERRNVRARERWRDPNKKLQRQVRAKVNWALRSGKIKPRPCEVCGADIAQAHHDDYSRPFDLRWLCQWHHSLAHKQLRALEGEHE